MFKALLKKQMMEVNTWLIQDKKSGKRRSKNKITMMILLYIVVFGTVGGIFVGLAYSLCGALYILNLGWLYYALMSLIAIVMGVFGSVFNTFTTLYEAKDNELLLSMPIKPSYILTARILGVYLWSFIYTALVFVPAMIVYFIYGEFNIATLVSGILLLIIISVFVLALSCVLGWVVAKINGKLKNKSLVTVIASLTFIAVYYLVYFNAMKLVQNFLNNALTIGATIKGSVLPVYWLGSAGAGDFLSLLLIAAIVGFIMALTLYVMSHSFLKMATTNKGANKRVYKQEKSKCKSIDAALLGKEFRRYAASANYMLNCSFGTLFLPILGVAALVKTEWIRSFISTYGIPEGIVLLIMCAAMCTLASLNDITSPSISLEGKNLWLVQSLPIHPWSILKAKLKLHLLLTEIPIIFCSVCLCIAADFDILNTVICIVLPMIFVAVMAALGLFLNLKMPNLTWTNEIVPIKQSASVTIALFGGWVIVIALGGLYFLVSKYMTEYLFLVICTAILVGLCTALLIWLKNKGAKLFSTL